MTRGKPWSLSDEKRLRDLIKEGKNAMEIAKNMGKTYVSVKGTTRILKKVEAFPEGTHDDQVDVEAYANN